MDRATTETSTREARMTELTCAADASSRDWEAGTPHGTPQRSRLRNRCDIARIEETAGPPPPRAAGHQSAPAAATPSRCPPFPGGCPAQDGSSTACHARPRATLVLLPSRAALREALGGRVAGRGGARARPEPVLLHRAQHARQRAGVLTQQHPRAV